MILLLIDQLVKGFPDREFSTQAPYPPAPCGYSTALGVSGWWRRAWQSLPRWWRVRPPSVRVGAPAPRAWPQIPTSDSPGIGAASPLGWGRGCGRTKLRYWIITTA